MTLEEKVNITRGFAADNVCAGNTGAVPRLGWPGMCLHDAGNGVRATDFVSSFPSALHVGATWDKNLTYERGLYMGLEFKAKGGECGPSPSWPDHLLYACWLTTPASSQCLARSQCRSSWSKSTGRP
jgi:hypothetical protein